MFTAVYEGMESRSLATIKRFFLTLNEKLLNRTFLLLFLRTCSFYMPLRIGGGGGGGGQD